MDSSMCDEAMKIDVVVFSLNDSAYMVCKLDRIDEINLSQIVHVIC